jgi:hypothetical protein
MGIVRAQGYADPADHFTDEVLVVELSTQETTMWMSSESSCVKGLPIGLHLG